MGSRTLSNWRPIYLNRVMNEAELWDCSPEGYLTRRMTTDRVIPRPAKPAPIKYTATEGGDWIEWDAGSKRSLHSVMFEDGSVFDSRSGWRPWSTCVHCNTPGKGHPAF